MHVCFFFLRLLLTRHASFLIFLYLDFKKKGEKGAKGAKTFSNAPRAAVLDAPFSRGQKKGARDAPVT